jgi:hypothetical protein
VTARPCTRRAGTPEADPGRSLPRSDAINLFASPDAGRRYLDANTLQGSILSIPEAATAGRWLFGDLLNSLDDAEPR